MERLCKVVGRDERAQSSLKPPKDKMQAEQRHRVETVRQPRG